MTEFDESIIRWTVRISMACYCGFLVAKVGGYSKPRELTRWLWTLGLIFFLLHLLAAFGLYHEWSHSHAYEHTADRTLETVGWHWGGGVYFNYLLSVVWTIDVGLWWIVGLEWPKLNRVYQIILHGFFAFMVLNATVVFGPRGWIFVGILMGLLLALSKWQRSVGIRKIPS